MSASHPPVPGYVPMGYRRKTRGRYSEIVSVYRKVETGAGRPVLYWMGEGGKMERVSGPHATGRVVKTKVRVHDVSSNAQIRIAPPAPTRSEAMSMRELARRAFE